MNKKLLLGIFLPVLVTAKEIYPPKSFGRFESFLSNCTWNINGKVSQCLGLQIKQIGGEGMRLRFIASGEESGTTHHLNLVTLNNKLEDKNLLSCKNSKCVLNKKDWKADIISISQVIFNSRGLPSTVPKGISTRGHCLIKNSSVKCHGITRGGKVVNVDAKIKAAPTLRKLTGNT